MTLKTILGNYDNALTALAFVSVLVALTGCAAVQSDRANTVKVFTESGRADDGTPFTTQLLRSESDAPCSKGGNGLCVRYTLRTANPSDEALLCDSALQGESFKSMDLPTGLVTPGQSVSLRFAISAADSVSGLTTQCNPPPPPIVPPECKSEITRTAYVNLILPGPPPSKADKLKPIVLEYTLRAAQGHPSDIAIINSSHYPQLDAAAIKMFGAQTMKTACPGHRFRSPVQLSHR